MNIVDFTRQLAKENRKKCFMTILRSLRNVALIMLLLKFLLNRG